MEGKNCNSILIGGFFSVFHFSFFFSIIFMFVRLADKLILPCHIPGRNEWRTPHCFIYCECLITWSLGKPLSSIFNCLKCPPSLSRFSWSAGPVQSRWEFPEAKREALVPSLPGRSHHAHRHLGQWLIAPHRFYCHRAQGKRTRGEGSWF